MKKLLLASLVSLMAVSSAYAKDIAIKQDRVFCEKYSSSIICNESVSTAENIGKKDPYIANLKYINDVIKHKITYKPDEPNNDVWNSYFDKLDKNVFIEGDCDDVTITAVEYAVSKGVPKERLGRAIVATAIVEEMHMVAVYHSVEENRDYFFADVFDNDVELVTTSPYELQYINWLSDGKLWIHLR